MTADSLLEHGDVPGHYLSRSQVELRKQKMRDDVWLYMQWVCQPHRSSNGGSYVERFHRPLAYMLKGDALRLAASLETYKSEVVRQIKIELQRRHINWQTSSGIRALRALLQRVNDRISRSMGKTTCGLDILSSEGTFNPDLDIGIASKSDPAAWEMCSVIGRIMRSDEYAMYFPERLYPLSSGKGFNYDSFITQEWIKFNGGTIPDHKTIIAKGINSQWYSWHGHIIYCDDLCSTEAKQGVATVEDALRFIASMSGLSKADQWGGTRELFNGTITGPRDDNAKLARNDDYLSIRIPIWTKPALATMRNMMLDGEPVLPEWYSVDDIRRKRKKELDDDQGRISWLQNFELTAHEAGVMSFTQDLINRSKFCWVPKKFLINGKEVAQRWIRRYLFEIKWETLPDGTKVDVVVPKRSNDTRAVPPLQNGEQCMCYSRCKFDDHAYVEYNPASLPRVLGVDQSFSASGDPWSISNISRDPQGVLYALRGRSAIGYPLMIAAIPTICSLYGGRDNFPRTVGIESNGVQSNTAYWMQRSEEVFGLLARRITPVSPGIIPKTMRIYNNVYAGMDMGTLMIDPDYTEFIDEALKYDGTAKNPVDNILDSVAIGVVLHDVRASDPDEDRKQRMADDKAWWSAVDPQTGVDTTTNFMDDMESWSMN